jgi:hypothetical protein
MCTTPSTGNAGKPHQGDGAEKLANAAGAVLLHHEQAKQNHQGNGNDEPVQRGEMTSRPSTADNTEMAGVMTPSP